MKEFRNWIKKEGTTLSASSSRKAHSFTAHGGSYRRTCGGAGRRLGASGSSVPTMSSDDVDVYSESDSPSDESDDAASCEGGGVGSGGGHDVTASSTGGGGGGGAAQAAGGAPPHRHLGRGRRGSRRRGRRRGGKVRRGCPSKRREQSFGL
jgi:hypothetical protein